jgi:hypothetical protein
VQLLRPMNYPNLSTMVATILLSIKMAGDLEARVPQAEELPVALRSMACTYGLAFMKMLFA